MVCEMTQILHATGSMAPDCQQKRSENCENLDYDRGRALFYSKTANPNAKEISRKESGITGQEVVDEGRMRLE